MTAVVAPVVAESSPVRSTAEREPSLLRSWSTFGPLVFTLPFLTLAVLTTRSDFISSQHAQTIFNALAVHDTGEIDSLGLSSPPLTLLYSFIIPTLPAIRALAAFAAGATAWVIWRQLQEAELPSLLRVLLLASFASAPAILFMAGAQASEMLALLLLLIAWRFYTRFIYFGITWNGFAAGLVLAVAFLASFPVVLFVIPFALTAPSALAYSQGRERGARADIASAMVIAFPALFAFVGWCYIEWVFTGNPFAFVADPRSQLSAYSDPSLQNIVGLKHAIPAAVGDLLRAPLYLVVGVLMFRRDVRSVVAYAFPFMLITVARIIGVPYSEPFAIGTYLGFALVAIVAVSIRPHRVGEGGRRLLIGALTVGVIVQLGTAVVPLESREARAWDSAVLDDRFVPVLHDEATAAAIIKSLPSNSVLADYGAYQVVARSGTTKPFVLPSDGVFDLAVSNPGGHVDHILVSTTPSAFNRMGDRFIDRAPGFYVDVDTPEWRILTRDGATSVTAGSGG